MTEKPVQFTWDGHDRKHFRWQIPADAQQHRRVYVKFPDDAAFDLEPIEIIGWTDFPEHWEPRSFGPVAQNWNDIPEFIAELVN